VTQSDERASIGPLARPLPPSCSHLILGELVGDRYRNACGGRNYLFLMGQKINKKELVGDGHRDACGGRGQSRFRHSSFPS